MVPKPQTDNSTGQHNQLQVLQVESVEVGGILEAALRYRMVGGVWESFRWLSGNDNSTWCNRSLQISPGEIPNGEQ